MTAVPRTMRAVLLTGHGGLEMLDHRADVPVPSAAAGEVLIAVAACGMNNTDINTRTGWYAEGSWGGGLLFPRIQGADPVGRIVAVGSGVEASRVGERVMIDPWLRDPDGDLERAGYLGSERDGGFAEYLTVPAANAYAVDSDLSDVELATFACSSSTAEHMVQRAQVRAGQTVLVTGASGGVGSALVQLCARRGARVVAVTSAAKAAALADLGADIVLDRAAGPVAEQVRDIVGRLDVLADVVGGEAFAPLLETIRRGGHYVTAGAIAGPIVPLDLRTLYLHDLTLHGATVLPPSVFADLVGYIERGEVRPVVAGTFPLAQIAAAQEAFLRKSQIGSYVLRIT